MLKKITLGYLFIALLFVLSVLNYGFWSSAVWLLVLLILFKITPPLFRFLWAGLCLTGYVLGDLNVARSVDLKLLFNGQYYKQKKSERSVKKYVDNTLKNQ